MFSFWEQKSFLADADLVVVGAGLVGLNAAIEYKQRRPLHRVIVLERGPFPSGASTKNAGFACFGSISELLDDLEGLAPETVFEIVYKRWNGLKKLRERVGDRTMDFFQWGGYEVFNDEVTYLKCRDKIDYFNKELTAILGENQVFKEANDNAEPFGLKKGTRLIFNCLEGQLNPAKMMIKLLELARGMGIFVHFGLEVNEWERSGAKVQLNGDTWSIKAVKVLFATNGFAARQFPGLALKPARNQVLITRPVEGLALKGTFHMDRGYYYFRNVGKRVLLGGGRHLDYEKEITELFGLSPVIQSALLELLKEIIFPGRSFEVEQWWSGILGVGPQKTPIVKWMEEGVAVAVRLGGMGVAIGSLVGEEAAQLLID